MPVGRSDKEGIDFSEGRLLSRCSMVGKTIACRSLAAWAGRPYVHEFGLIDADPELWLGIN